MAESDPKQLLADIEKAARQLSNNRQADALLVYQDVKKRAGRHAGVHYQLGRLCGDLGDPDQAAEHYSTAVEAEPDNAQYLAALGIACQSSGRNADALDALERALDLNPDMPEVLHALGNIAMDNAEHETACRYFERACELKPSNAGVRTNLAMSLAKLDRHADALEHARKAVRLDDSKPRAHYALCSILTELGRMDEAVVHLEKTIRRHRTFGSAYDLLARIRQFSENDSAFIRNAEKVLERGMPAHERYSLHYALGKMHDDCRHYDEAFAHYEQANLVQKRQHDFTRDVRLFKQIKRTFSAAALKSASVSGHESAQPVFVVGMPRTGTTLIEQMIANHPQAAGAGELPEMTRIGRLIAEQPGTRDNGAAMRQHADSYLAALRRGRPGADRIVDKMPGNFFFLGLIVTLFPKASIIHAVRHPLDTCLSCYFQNFSDLTWANDFESIARMYSLYREAIDYWRRTLPYGTILDLHYEQLVDDPEDNARRMIEHCGLEWDDAVMDFHRGDNVVRTASVAQVREPVYKSSKMRWLNYATHLQPLAEQLAEYLEDERVTLAEHGLNLPARGWLKRLLK